MVSLFRSISDFRSDERRAGPPQEIIILAIVVSLVATPFVLITICLVRANRNRHLPQHRVPRVIDMNATQMPQRYPATGARNNATELSAVRSLHTSVVINNVIANRIFIPGDQPPSYDETQFQQNFEKRNVHGPETPPPKYAYIVSQGQQQADQHFIFPR